MKNSIILIFGFCTLIFTTASHTVKHVDFVEVKDIAVLKEKIVEKAKNTHSVQCDFIEEKHFVMFGDVLLSEGAYFFKEDAQHRWDYSSGQYQSFVIKGNKAFVKKQNETKPYRLNQNPSFQLVNELFQEVWNGVLFNTVSFDFHYYENEHTYMVQLVPSEQRLIDQFGNIDLYFSKIDYGLIGIKVMEYNIDYTVIKLQNRVLNNKLEDALFDLKRD